MLPSMPKASWWGVGGGWVQVRCGLGRECGEGSAEAQAQGQARGLDWGSGCSGWGSVSRQACAISA